MMVETMRFQDVLDHFPEIRDHAQLCSIDVEGAEEQAIESCDWRAFRPKIVIVEHAAFEPSRADQQRPNRLAELMGERNYEMVHRNNLNLVFRRIDDR
jgi:hypothetical protein